MIKKIFFVLLSGIIILNEIPSYSAEAPAVPDDDSAIFMPIPTKTEEKPVKKSVRKAPVKKPVKRTPPKKPIKKTPPKPQPPKVSSLERAIELIQQERYEDAKVWLVKAIRENKNDPNVWYWYGVYHEKTGGLYQAQHFYSKAVTIDPGFEPLSRVVVYPHDETKTPLWDPKRPARVYPIETSRKGVVIVPPNSPQSKKLPSRPVENDPELPKVPIYNPPEPGSMPLDGDKWQPGIYVPPTANQARNQTHDGQPVYIPPSVSGTSGGSVKTPVLELKADDLILQTSESENDDNYSYNNSNSDLIIRVDKPVYQPPKPGEKRNYIPPQKYEQVRSSSTSTSGSGSEKRPAVPRRVVRKGSTVAQQPRQTRQSRVNNNSSQASSNSSRVSRNLNSRSSSSNNQLSRDLRPSRPSQQRTEQRVTPSVPQTPSTENQRNQTRPSVPERPERQPERQIERQPERPVERQHENSRVESSREKSFEHLPPVGQFSPDPGTISDVPLPPVGQRGSSN